MKVLFSSVHQCCYSNRWPFIRSHSLWKWKSSRDGVLKGQIKTAQIWLYEMIDVFLTLREFFKHNLNEYWLSMSEFESINITISVGERLEMFRTPIAGATIRNEWVLHVYVDGWYFHALIGTILDKGEEPCRCVVSWVVVVIPALDLPSTMPHESIQQ
jgi:hypothetical protein